MKRKFEKSQHFLRNPDFVKELIGHSYIKKSDLVLDIGAGSGIISFVLSSRVKEVIAIEHDPDMVETLKDNLAGIDNIHIEHADILTMPLPEKEYSVFSNIPFHLSAPIVRRLSEATNRPQSIYLIAQKQFAQKLSMDQSSFTSMLGAQLAPYYNVRIRKTLKRTDFSPPPRVDTVLLELTSRVNELSEDEGTHYRDFVQHCFESPIFFAKHNAPLLERSRVPKPSELSLADWMIIFRQSTK